MLGNKNNNAHNCCVCLCKSPNLILLTSSKNADPENWLTKLKKCVSEIVWCDDDLLCQACSNQLDFVHNFRQLCFQSNETRQSTYLYDESKCESFLIDPDKKKNLVEDGAISLVKAEPNCSGESTYLSCDSCTANFLSKCELDLHCKQTHGDEDSSNNDTFDDTTSVFNNESDLENDSDSYSDALNTKYKRVRKKKQTANFKQSNPYVKVKENSETEICKREYLDLKCQACENVLDTVSKLMKHCLTEHNMEKKEVKPYACPKCPWRFRIPYSLRDHIKYHDNIRNEVCTYCGKGFVTKAALTTHEKQHLNLREYQCPHCPKSFNTHKDIRTHKYVVHTDPSKWKHVCPVCSKRFPVKSNFDAHVRRHNNEKPYGCHLCDAKFCVPSSLRIHIQSHSNVRDHRCSECGNEYKNIKYLQQHMNKKHNIGNVKVPEKVKKFVCNLCPKRFDAKNKLARHLCSHTGERPFACSVCDKRFTDKSYVNQHMKTIHNFVPENDR